MADGHEQVLISALMNGTTELPVTGEDFLSRSNQTIFECVTGLTNRSPIAVTDELRRSGQLEKVGGVGRITEISLLPHDAETLDYALSEVLEHSRKRRAAKVADQLRNGDIGLEEAHAELGTLIAAASGRGEFTVRSGADILELKLDEHDCLIGERLLSKGGKIVMAGPAGVGKSKLLEQLAAACISGRDFVGIETHAKDLPWLILQTENSNRRLQNDLRALKREFGPGFLDSLFIHTIECDTDGFVALDDESAVRRMEAVIRKIQPAIIAVDPLRDFIPGDPNSDADMTAAVAALGRICRVSDPTRSIVVVHHALTGRAGASKATGWERSGFARNSKVLLGWTRAQVNVAPGAADDNSTLVISCGKNNDGKEFPPLAVQLNQDTMIYEPVEDFSIEGWLHSLSAKPQRFTIDMLRDIKFNEMEIKPLAQLICNKIGCGRSRAYELVGEAVKAKIFKFNKLIDTYVKA
jgi:AAA domain-containing protein/DnaB helicase-like protein